MKLLKPFVNAMLFSIKKFPICNNSIALSLRIRSTTWRLIKVITMLQLIAIVVQNKKKCFVCFMYMVYVVELLAETV